MGCYHKACIPWCDDVIIKEEIKTPFVFLLRKGVVDKNILTYMSSFPPGCLAHCLVHKQLQEKVYFTGEAAVLLQEEIQKKMSKLIPQYLYLLCFTFCSIFPFRFALLYFVYFFLCNWKLSVNYWVIFFLSYFLLICWALFSYKLCLIFAPVLQFFATLRKTEVYPIRKMKMMNTIKKSRLQGCNNHFINTINSNNGLNCNGLKNSIVPLVSKKLFQYINHYQTCRASKEDTRSFTLFHLFHLLQRV